MIKKQISIHGINSAFSTNFFIAGGGSKLLNLEDYCSKFFGFKIKKINNISEKEEKEDYNQLSACLGALKIIKDGWETEAIPEPANKNNQCSGFFFK